ncbi:MAG: M28 family peptidase, partial [bacterium]
MRRQLWVFLLILPLTTALALDWNLVRIPAPENAVLQDVPDFKLFHRAGDFWIGSLPEGAILPEGGQILNGYDPQNGELFRLLLANPSEADVLEGRVTVLYRDADEAIIQATIPQLEALPQIRAEWVRITLAPKPQGYSSGKAGGGTDDFHPFVQELVNQVSQMQYTTYIQALEDFVTRNTYTTNCDQAAAYILSQFQSFGLDASYDLFTIGSYTKRNVVGELTGLVYPDSLIFITGHYDATAGSPSSPEANAPGADDNASGTSCVLECARILSQYNFEKTIRFVGFAGEEQGLYGSEDYVANLQSAGAHVVGSFNYDMIAWSGNDPLPPDMVLYCDNNPRSQAMANKVAEAITTFLPTALEPDVDIAPSMTGSDHAPFWDVGWAAICGIEEQAWGPDFNPYYHSTSDLVSNCDLDYATNCTRVAIAALADYAIPIVGSGPYLGVSDKVIDDIGGNENGAPDPGETCSMTVTLINVGNEAATGVSAVLSTADPYLTITQSSSTYPDLNPQNSGTSVTAYQFNISAACPQGTWMTTTLAITANGGAYTNSALISFLVGDPMYDPVGPDGYGYYAYDVYDLPEAPVYNWTEIAPAAGGPGTEVSALSGQDDASALLTLPFTFQYYGVDFNQITICTNGWIALGDASADSDWSNSGIPDSDGPPNMVAPFWEDMNLETSGQIATYFNAPLGTFIVEFYRVPQWSPSSALETFEVIFHDPAVYPTATGDGKILFQYQQVSDPSSATVGIENGAETIGLQYMLNGGYDTHAAPLDSGMAILYTTMSSFPNVVVTLTPVGTPIQIPATGGSFDFNIAITNNEATAQNFTVWCLITLPNGLNYGPVLGPVNVTVNPGATINRDRTQNVPGAARTGMDSYNAYIGNYPNVIW